MTPWEHETVPCEFCGQPTMMTSTKKCDGCWEVTGRIVGFLRHARGREYVRASLLAADQRARKERTK